MKTPADHRCLALALAISVTALDFATLRAAESNDPGPVSAVVTLPLTNRENSAVVTNAPTEAAAPSIVVVTSTVPAEVRLAPRDVDHFRQEMEAVATRNAQMLSATIEPILKGLQQRELTLIESTNRTIFIGAAVFAGAGLVGFLLVAWMLVRAMGRFSEMVTQQGDAVRAIGYGRMPAALGPGNAPSGAALTEQSSKRFLRAIERLEKRIHELEITTPGAVLDADAPATTDREGRSAASTNARGQSATIPASAEAASHASEDAEEGEAAQFEMLAGKGHSLLSLNQADEALRCFDEALRIQPDHADTLVKRGMALEKLLRLDEAIQCYDRAIAADESLTVAWLHKGGLCNRLERHQEALECYDQAIRREQKTEAPGGSTG